MSFLVHRNGSNFGNHYFYCVHRSLVSRFGSGFCAKFPSRFSFGLTCRFILRTADSFWSYFALRLSRNRVPRRMLFAEFLLFAHGKGKSSPDIRHQCVWFFLSHTTCIEPHYIVGKWFLRRFFTFSVRNQIELQLPKFNQKLLSFGLKTIFSYFFAFDCWCWMYFVDVFMLVWWREQTHSWESNSIEIKMEKMRNNKRITPEGDSLLLLLLLPLSSYVMNWRSLTVNTLDRSNGMHVWRFHIF